MKKLILAVTLLITSIIVQAQQVEWAALEDFHKVMAQTFHPAEDGDMQPVMKRSGELAQKARDLQHSNIPESYQSKEIKVALKNLTKQTALVDKMVKKGKSEAEIKKALFVAHDRFHDVMGACDH